MKYLNKWKLASSTLLLFAMHSCTGQTNTIDHAYGLVREAYNGDNAYNTVAFVEKYWRIAGNEGFNASIRHVEGIMKEAGYVLESESAPNDLLTYRVEVRPMDQLTWEPVDGSVLIEGDDSPLLTFDTNRNMLAVNSWSTNGKVSGTILWVQDASREAVSNLDVEGKILFADGNLRNQASDLFARGAIGIMDYYVPEYLNPDVNVHSIQFRGIRQDAENKPYAIVLSTEARNRLVEKLNEGEVTVTIDVQTKLYESEELTLVAEAKGSEYPDERFVFSAHVQEPGANDNASGVGAQAEMARVLASFVKTGAYTPARTITFLFGDEIVSTNRFIKEEPKRAEDIRWGMSLDMVGENTDVTGGSFLIEKMPDPAAVWLRGEDKHTEWGGRPLDPDQIVNHYFNDLVYTIFLNQGEFANWTVNVNPYEGGSDHVPFLRADIPGVLVWHFTDQFYHTDGDRLDKVSKETLQNVGSGALVTGMVLASSNEAFASEVLQLLETQANQRLQTELTLSKQALQESGDAEQEITILRMWTQYYVDVCASVTDMTHAESSELQARIQDTQSRIQVVGEEYINQLK